MLMKRAGKGGGMMQTKVRSGKGSFVPSVVAIVDGGGASDDGCFGER